MNIFFELAFLFFIGSVIGWVMELLFRRFFSRNNPQRKWINPGFCTGPYLPLYGCGLCILYLIASLEKYAFFNNPVYDKILLFLIMAVSMTVIEYITGLVSLKFTNIRLWDYSSERGNIKGLICPKFSFIWALLGGIYYFFIHKYIKDSVKWLGENLAFSFFIGLFFGVFIIDMAHSMHLVAKIKKFADENDVIVRYENFKLHIRQSYEEASSKYHFFRPFSSERPIIEHLRDIHETLEKRIRKK